MTSVHGWALFFPVFGVIFAAELPDKTALAALVLATRHRPLPVLLGAGAALTVQTLVAVLAGNLVALLPRGPVHIFAGGLFLVSAAAMWFRKEEEEEEETEARGPAGFWRSAWLVFVVVFVAEWGDLTQLATAGFAADQRSPYVVFAAATAALWAVTALATLAGNRAGKLLDAGLTKRIAAVVFAGVGGALLAGVL